MPEEYKFRLVKKEEPYKFTLQNMSYADTSEDYKSAVRGNTQLPAVSYTPDRNFAEDVFAAIQNGTVQSYEMVLKSLDSLGLMDSKPELLKIKKLKQQSTWDDPSKAMIEGDFRESLYGGISSAVSSILAGIPGAAVGGTIGALTAGPAGAVAGGIVGAARGAAFQTPALFGLSQYYDVMEEGRQAGIPMGVLKSRAIAAGAVEGGLELVSNLLFNRIFGLSKVAPTKELISALSKKPGQRFLQNLAKSVVLTASEEIPTEMAQEWAGIKIRESAGIPVSISAEEAAKQVIGPTLVSSTIFALAGLGGQTMKRNVENMRIRASELNEKIAGGKKLTFQELQEVKDISELRNLTFEKWANSQLREKENYSPTLTEQMRTAFTRDPLVPQLEKAFKNLGDTYNKGELAINDLLIVMDHVKKKNMGSEANQIAVKGWFKDHFPEVEISDDMDIDKWTDQILKSDLKIDKVLNTISTIFKDENLQPTTETGKQIVKLSEEIGTVEQKIPEKEVGVTTPFDRDQAITDIVNAGGILNEESQKAVGIPDFEKLQTMTDQQLKKERIKIADNYRTIESENLNDEQKKEIRSQIENLDKANAKQGQIDKEREKFFADRGMGYRGEGEEGNVMFDDKEGSTHYIEPENMTPEGFDVYMAKYNETHGIDVREAQSDTQDKIGIQGSVEEGQEPGRPVQIEETGEEAAEAGGVLQKTEEITVGDYVQFNKGGPEYFITGQTKTRFELIDTKGRKQSIMNNTPLIKVSKEVAEEEIAAPPSVETVTKPSETAASALTEEQGEQVEVEEIQEPGQPGMAGEETTGTEEAQTKGTTEVPPPEIGKTVDENTRKEKVSKYLKTLKTRTDFIDKDTDLGMFRYVEERHADLVNSAAEQFADLGEEQATRNIENKLDNEEELKSIDTFLLRLAQNHLKETGQIDRLANLIGKQRKTLTESGQYISSVKGAYPKTDTLEGMLLSSDQAVDAIKRKKVKKDPAVGRRINEGAKKAKAEIDKIKNEEINKLSGDIDKEIEKMSKDKPEEMLAQRIIKQVKPKDRKAPTLIKAMVKELFGVAMESPIERDVPGIDPSQPIVLAMKNSELYKETWAKAKEIVMKEFEENAEAQAKLQDYFDNGADPQFTRSHLDAFIKKGIKELNLDLGQLARSYSQTGQRGIAQLTNYLIDNTGLDKESSARLAVYISDRVETKVKDRSISILNQILTPKMRGQSKSTAQIVTELINLGGYGNETYENLMKLKEKLPVLDKKDVDFITKRMMEAEAFPEGSWDRFKITDEVGQYILRKLPGESMIMQALNIPRSLMASFDFSAPFRQGLFLISKPKRFAEAFKVMFGAAFSEEQFNQVRYNVGSMEHSELAKTVGLPLTELDAALAKREESFQSQLAERIPGLGPLVRASSRAYGAFLNTMRMGNFNDMVNKAIAMGIDPYQHIEVAQNLAKFIGSATGRGDLGQFERAAIALNTFFFSPRLMKSRFDLLSPRYYYKLDSFTRKEALKTMFASTGMLLSMATFAVIAGAKVEKDPRNADFGKIRIGSTRIDISGGILQYLRIGAQLVTGKVVSSTTGKTMVLGEKGAYRPLTRLDIATRFFENKEAPIVSFITNFMRGTNTIGEEFHVGKETMNRLVPMVVQDMLDLAREQPELLPASALGLFGFGVQTYATEPDTIRNFNYRFSNLEDVYQKYSVIKKESPQKARQFMLDNKPELLEFRRMKSISRSILKMREMEEKIKDRDMPFEEKQTRINMYENRILDLINNYNARRV